MKPRFIILVFLVSIFLLSSGATRIPPVSADSAQPPMQQLSWTTGTAYPVVNGQTIYPPQAAPVLSTTGGSPDQYHWYAGGSYSGTSANATNLFAQIKVDSKEPKSSQFYYVLSSLWDNVNSYDQIGYSNDYGVWGLTYSYTTGSCNDLDYHYNPDAMNLNVSTVYKFNITTTSSGELEFRAFVGSTEVWHLKVHSGATSLSVATYGCDNEYYGYTVYEEVYSSTPNGVPNFNFHFQKNTYLDLSTDKWTDASWSVLNLGAPSKVSVKISGDSVVINN